MSQVEKTQFNFDIFEVFSNKNVIQMSKQIGYKDYKYMLYGNNMSYPISFHINILHTGRVIMCQPPRKILPLFLLTIFILYILCYFYIHI